MDLQDGAPYLYSRMRRNQPEMRSLGPFELSTISHGSTSCLVQTQLSVQLIGTTFVLFAQTLMSFTGLGLSFASTLRPLLQSGETLLEMGSPLGHLRVLHRNLGETVIGVQSQRESSSL